MDADAGANISCLVDNAMLINASSLLQNPSTFDVHKLTDLDTVCQAILLNDRIHTIIGRSFRAGIHRFGGIYGKLLDQGILQAQTVSAGHVHYRLRGLNRLDMIARALDLDPVIANVEQVFNEGIPWLSGPDERQARYSLLFGQDSHVSDSFPTYYFPPREPIITSSDDWGPKHRNTSWVATFVSQTFFYIAEAARRAIPYYCSGPRIPVVAGLNKAIRTRFFSVVHAALGHIERSVAEQVREVLDFLGEEAVQPVYLPGLAFALRHVRSRESFFEDLISLRGHPELTEFRRWATATRQAWLAQDVQAVRRAIAQLRQVGQELAQLPDPNSAIAFVPKPDLAAFIPVDASGHEAAVDHRMLVRSVFDPVPAFLTDVGASLLEIGETRAAVEQLVERQLSDADLQVMRSLADARSALYSPGMVASPNAPVTYQTVEVTMGDRFENISQSTIVNRSHLESSLNRARDIGDPAAAEALRTLAAAVERSGNARAVDTFDRFTEELARPEPRKGRLRSLWDGLVAALPTLKDVAGLADNIAKLFA